MGITVEEGPNGVDDFRHAGLAANKDHLGDFLRRQFSILQGGLAWANGTVDQVGYQGFQLGARDADVEVLWTALIGGDKGQVHVCLRRRRQFDLCLLGGVLQALQCESILAEVDALVLTELIGQELDNALVEILTTKECVAIGCPDFEHAFADL